MDRKKFLIFILKTAVFVFLVTVLFRALFWFLWKYEKGKFMKGENIKNEDIFINKYIVEIKNE